MIEGRRTGIFGRSGAGKSTRARALTAGARRLVRFDPLAEYRDGHQVGTLAAVLDVMGASWSRGFRVNYQCRPGHEAEALSQLADALVGVQARTGRRKRLLLMVEEMNLAYPAASLPRDLAGFHNLVARGRHHAIDLVGVSQRVAEVSTRFRGNMSDAYFFAVADHRDVQAITALIGPEWRDPLRTLANHEYLYWRGGQVERGRNRPPRR